ncbi:MAG TPA: hypothetical protein VGK29_20605 [Paludibaculum sp.]|jgi:hypothetical protein
MEKATKNPAAVALGRKGGQKGGPARAAKLAAEQRSESARKAVQARWAKAAVGAETAGTRGRRIAAQATEAKPAIAARSASDRALLSLLEQIRGASKPAELRTLTDQLERLIFQNQFNNA